jgi:hydrogenase-4 component E
MTAAGIVEDAAGLIIALGVALALTRSIGRSILMVAAQSILAGIAAIAVGVSLGQPHIVVGGMLAIAFKGLVAPIILRAMLRSTSIAVERQPYLGTRLSLVAAVGIVFLAAAATSDIGPTAAPGAARALPAAIAQVLTGLLLVMTRRKVLSLLVGLMVFENGIALTAFALTYGMPLVVELGIAFDLLVAVAVGWVYTRRMVAVLGTASTDSLRNLRG